MFVPMTEQVGMLSRVLSLGECALGYWLDVLVASFCSDTCTGCETEVVDNAGTNVSLEHLDGFVAFGLLDAFILPFCECGWCLSVEAVG